MDERQELNDLLIEDDEREEPSGGSKKLLLIGAAAALLFLMAIFVVYTLNRGEEEPPPMADALPKLDSPQEVVAADQNMREEPLFEQVPIEEMPVEKPATSTMNDAEKAKEKKFEEIVNEIKEKQAAKTAEPAEEAKKIPAPKAVVETKKPVTEKPIAAKSQSSSAPAKSADPNTVKNVPAGFYVQVGAFFKFTPDKKFLDTIQENRYQYHQLATIQNGKEVTKVLIGPFANRTQAKEALLTIKQRINQGAFISQL